MLFEKMKNFLTNNINININTNNKRNHIQKSSALAFYIILTFLCFTVLSESVCDHELLIMELKQDLEDNGILDCLRYLLKKRIKKHLKKNFF